MQIAKDKIAEIEYKLTNDDGKVLDSTEGGKPLAYLHGSGTIIPGLETALDGKTAGDNVQLTLPPSEAYGERNEALRQQVSPEQFQGVDDLQVGMQFRAQTEAGSLVMTVVDVGENAVTVDGNHPLAGKTLHFDVTVNDVREATPEEIEHGHAHGPDGHQH